MPSAPLDLITSGISTQEVAAIGMRDAELARLVGDDGHVAAVGGDEEQVAAARLELGELGAEVVAVERHLLLGQHLAAGGR